MRLYINQTKIFAMTAVLSAVMLFSTFMSGTFAWKDFLQSYENLLTAPGVPRYTVELNKLERDINGDETGIAIKNAQFVLYKTGENGGEDEQLGGLYFTDQDGKISLDGLKVGSYYFLEINPTYGYTYDKDGQGQNIKKYTFTIAENSSDKTITVKAYNQKRSAALTISKTVKNADKSELTNNQKDKAFEFTVTFSDGKSYEYSIEGGASQTISSGGKIELKSGEKAEITGIPVGVQYTVIETPENGYGIQSDNYQGNIPLEGVTASFVNTYDENLLTTGGLNISKTVQGEGADLEKEFIFTVKFEGIHVPSNIKYTIGNESHTLDPDGKIKLKHGETAVFDDLPEGLEYTVTEDDYSADDYLASVQEYTGKIVRINYIDLPFTNVFETEPKDKTDSLYISKQVSGNAADKEKEFEFTVKFSDNGSITMPALINYQVKDSDESLSALTPLPADGKIKLKHGQIAIFPDLPVGLIYKVTEGDYSGDGYTATLLQVTGLITESVIRPGGAYARFINVKNDYPNTELTVRKEISGDFPEADKDKKFKFTVLVNGMLGETFEIKAGEEYGPITIPYGSVYQITEEDYVGDEYIQSGITNGYGTATGADITAVQTNKFIGTIMTGIGGEKTWSIPAGVKVTLPDSIYIYLKNGKNVIDNKSVTPDQDGNWLYSFTAPKYDENGEKIEYMVREVIISGFVPSYDDELNIVNTYIEPAKGDPPIVKKIIQGDKPEMAGKFSFKLTPLDGAPMPDGLTGSKTMALTGAGEIEFGDILFDTAGTFVYNINEVKGNAQGYTYDNTVYKLTYVVEEKDGKLTLISRTYTKVGETGKFDKAEFVNTYSKDAPPPVIKTDKVTVNKVWTGNDPNRPQSVKVQLYKNGKAYGNSVTLSDANKWKYTWTGLDKNAAWTVDETAVPDGYSKEISGDAKEGYVITNKFIKVVRDPDNPGGNGNNGGSSKSPGTGDTSNTTFWMIMLVASLTGLWVTLVNKKRFGSKSSK